MMTRTPQLPFWMLLTGPHLVGCHMTGTEFINKKTGIALSPDISVCGSGKDENKYCKPNSTGGGSWQENANVPFHNIPAKYTSNEDIIAEVGRYYLGTPFFGGDLHDECKFNVTTEMITPQKASQELDLAGEISRRSVTDLVVEFQAELKAKNIDITAEITNKFEMKLEEEVRQKVKANFIWFVLRHRGGADGVANNKHLVSCSNVLAKHLAEQDTRRKDGAFVTGIAGYVVRSNKIDAELASSSTISNALEAALEGKYPQQVADLRGSLAVKWKKSVEKTVRVTFRKEELYTVAYPLWVQLERGNPVERPEFSLGQKIPNGESLCSVSKPDIVHTSGPGEQGSVEVATCKGLLPGRRYTFKLTYLANTETKISQFKPSLSLRLCQASRHDEVCAEESTSESDVRANNEDFNYIESEVSTVPMPTQGGGEVKQTLRLTYAEGGTVKQFSVIPKVISVTEVRSSELTHDRAMECPPDMKLIRGTGAGGVTLASGEHAVVMDLCVDSSEVTVKDYFACKSCEQTNSIRRPSGEVELNSQCNAGRMDREGHPINCVSMKDARQYCEVKGKFLLSSHEWEWAARGRDAGTLYPWGTEPPDCNRAHMKGCRLPAGQGSSTQDPPATSQVGSHSNGNSPDGLADLSGNVWEWTRDSVLRGGSWMNNKPEMFMAGYQWRLSSDVRGTDTGFRCADYPKNK